MRKFKILLILLPALLLGTCQNSFGQVYQMVVDHVIPSMHQEYEDALKGYMEFLAENDYDLPMQIYNSRELHYFYATPMEASYADLDTLWMAINEVAKKDEEGYDKMFSKFEGTYDYSNSYCLYFSKSLSYIPEPDEENGEKMNCLEVWTIKVTLGKAPELNKLIKEYNAICKEKNVTMPTWVYTGLIGTEQGTYVMVNPGKDPADIWNKNMEVYKMIGEEGREVNDKMIKLLDKIEVEHIWERPDMSYEPSE